jgi:RNA polymerase sigma-70 factor, ECF subfamily
MADGPLRGLALLDQPALGKTLRDYHLFHAARADLLRRAGRIEQARDAYLLALKLCQNERERAFLQRRLAEVASPRISEEGL